MINNMTDFATSGGHSVVYIKATQDTKNYKKGQVIAQLPQSSFSIEFDNSGKEIKSNKNLVSNLELKIDRIVISPHSFSSGLFNLITNKKKVKTIKVPIREKVSTDSEGEGFLTSPAIDLALYTEDGEEAGFVYEEETDTITADENSTYIAEYYSKRNVAAAYSLDKKHLENVKIEILTHANVGENTDSKMLLTIPKASLFVEPILEYNSGEITRTDLSFNVIDSKAEVYFY